MIYLQQKLKLLFLNKSETVCLDLRWAIPKGFFGKVFPRSSLTKDHNVTVDAGLIDSDYRGLIYGLLVNHSDFYKLIKLLQSEQVIGWLKLFF